MNTDGTHSIIVNGEKKEILTSQLSYRDIILLAFKQESSALFTITYEYRTEENHSGSLLPNQYIQVKDGLIFDVTKTDNA